MGIDVTYYPLDEMRHNNFLYKFSYSNFLYITAPPQRVGLKINDKWHDNQYTIRMQSNNEGEELSVECVAKHVSPTPNFEWRLDGKVFEVRNIIMWKKCVIISFV